MTTTVVSSLKEKHNNSQFMTQVIKLWQVLCQLSQSKHQSLGKSSLVIMISEVKFPGVHAKWSESLLGWYIQVLNCHS